MGFSPFVSLATPFLFQKTHVSEQLFCCAAVEVSDLLRGGCPSSLIDCALWLGLVSTCVAPTRGRFYICSELSVILCKHGFFVGSKSE